MTLYRPALLALLLTVSLSAQTPTTQGLDLEPGLTYRLYDIGRPMQKLHPLAPDQSPNVHRRIATVDFPNDDSFGGPADQFLVEVEGYLRVKEAGTYTFRLRSDDGSVLRIGETVVIDHDGKHGSTDRDGSVTLSAGTYPLLVRMFEDGGGAALRLSWRRSEKGAFTLIPRSAFGTPRGVTLITSPGRKTILDGREHMRPGDGLALEGVHPGWSLETIRPPEFKPQVGALAFLPDGRLLVATFKPVNDGVFREKTNGTLWALPQVIDGPAGEPQKIAEGFHDPSGLAVVDGKIYVAHRSDITRLEDRDGDGVFEHREVFIADWVADNYHHFTFGLEHHEGYLYGSLSTSIYFGETIKKDGIKGEVVGLNGPNPAHRGTCFRIHIERREIEYLAGGFRTPNGVLVRPDGEIFIADNQGAWLPASKLIHVKRGRFYGHRNGTPEQRGKRYPDGGVPSLNSHRPESPPAVWLPQNECANSPSESVWLKSGPFAGQILVGELTTGGIRRIALEEVAGELQGAVFRFSQGFECGVNRLIEGPDGCLYLGGTGAGGSWTWRNTQFGLQRLRPRAVSAFEMHRVRATQTGFEIFFTHPVPRDQLEDPANYEVRQWNYESRPPYGGPKRHEVDLHVRRATAAGDGRSAHLEIPGRISGSVVHLRTDVRSENKESLWSAETWYTLNRIPREPSSRHRESQEHRPLDTPLSHREGELQRHWFEAATVRLGGDRRRDLVPTPGRGVVWTRGKANTPTWPIMRQSRTQRVHLEVLLSTGSEVNLNLGHGRRITLAHGKAPDISRGFSLARGTKPVDAKLLRRPGRWQSIELILLRRSLLAGQQRDYEVRLNGKTIATTRRLRENAAWTLEARQGPVALRNLIIRP